MSYTFDQAEFEDYVAAHGFDEPTPGAIENARKRLDEYDGDYAALAADTVLCGHTTQPET